MAAPSEDAKYLFSNKWAFIRMTHFWCNIQYGGRFEKDARVFIKTSEILNKWHTFDGIFYGGTEEDAIEYSIT